MTMLYKTILCATDGHEHSERAMRRAASIARETGAELHVVNVEETEPAPMRTGREYVAAERAETRERVKKQISAAVAGDRPVTATPHYLVNYSGSVAAQIAGLADRIDADLIVVGSHGRGVLTGALAGSVAQRLPHETCRPVLVLAGAGPGARRPSRQRIRQALHV
jgi:nucleotide-binding universal stress UspA family protein